MVAQHPQALRDPPDRETRCGPQTSTCSVACPAARAPNIRRRTGSPRQSNAGTRRLSHHQADQSRRKCVR